MVGVVGKRRVGLMGSDVVLDLDVDEPPELQGRA